MFQVLSRIADLVWQYRSLILNLTRRELTDRYAGQALGASWAVVHPLFLVLVYIFIFGVVFRARIDIPGVPQNYTVYIVSGLLPWLGLVDALGRSSLAISSNAALVKQIVFPTEVLVVRSVLAALFTQVIASILLVIYVFFALGYLPWTITLLPLLLVVQLVMATGLCFMVAAVGAYFRDIKDVVQVFAIVGMYLMPVVYLPNWLPRAGEYLISANPFSHMIWVYQDAVFYGRFEHPISWAIFAGLSLAALCVGYRLFQRLKPYFANVL